MLGIGDVDAADPVALGIGAHVDQLDGGIALQQLVRFLRRDGARIGRALIGAAAGGIQDIGGGGHGILDESGKVWTDYSAPPAPCKRECGDLANAP